MENYAHSLNSLQHPQNALAEVLYFFPDEA